MQYLLLANESDDAWVARTDPERSDEYWAAWRGFVDALTEAGVLVSAAGLQPPDVATTVRVVDGDRRVQDGPFAESKEHLGGYFLLDVDGLDRALEWAGRCPCITSPSVRHGSVEVRPVLPAPAS